VLYHEVNAYYRPASEFVSHQLSIDICDLQPIQLIRTDARTQNVYTVTNHRAR
jgi:hypothetical protein